MPCNNYLAGCITALNKNAKAPQKPREEATLGPFVQIGISAGGKQITVGNNSYPAVIKSFQYGGSNGTGVNIEIVDEEGGAFVAFVLKLYTLAVGSQPVLTVYWGWRSQSCEGSPLASPTPAGSCVPFSPTAQDVSCEHRFILLNISSTYVGNGLLKFIVEGTDPLTGLFESRVPICQGSDNSTKRVNMESAIKNLLKDQPLEVVFYRLQADTTVLPITYAKDSGISSSGGKLGLYVGLNEDVITTIESWLAMNLSDKNRSFELIFNSAATPPNLIVLESLKPATTSNFDDYNVATYLINAGCNSPVISFQPNIKYSAIMFPNGGGAGGAGRGGSANQNTPNVGFCPQDSQIKQGAVRALSPPRIFQEGNGKLAFVKNAQYQDLKSMASYTPQSITAELRIQGNPSLSNMLLLIGRYVTLVVFNPYTVGGTGAGNCSWTRKTGQCNSVYSSKAWRIEAVSHDIKDGSYTTTLKLNLALPCDQLAFISDQVAGTVGNTTVTSIQAAEQTSTV
jgi:hypothetical protein